VVNRDNYLHTQSFRSYALIVRQRKDNSVGRYWSCLRHLLLWADATLLSLAARIEPAFPNYLGQLPKQLAPAALDP
jgi:hypothetical protein